LIDRKQSIGSDLARVGELDRNARQRARAELDHKNTAATHREAGGKPIIEQAMRRDRQRDANNGQDYSARAASRSKARAPSQVVGF
jgi:hypothetical protein